MNFNNPIARSGLPRFNESSAQRSIRDSDATPRLWQKARSVEKNVQSIANAVENQQRILHRLRRRKGISEGGVVELVLIAVRGDYLVCSSAGADGYADGGLFLVAKNPKLRNSLASAVIDGATYNYAYTTTVDRSVSGGATETQVIVPRYIVEDKPATIHGDAIMAIPFDSGLKADETDGGGEINLLDLNVDGRAWAQQ
jgi:hypothetical protein